MSTIIHKIFRRESGLEATSSFKSNLFKDRLSISKNLFKRDLVSHFGCVNSIEFSKEGDWLISGGDDRRILMWNIHKSILDNDEPRIMMRQHLSNIFCLSFDCTNNRIFSGGNDNMVVIHDVVTGDCIDVFYHTKPVYGLSVDPSNENIFATAGEDGRVLLFDLRASNSDARTIVKYRAPFHGVMFHPVDNNFMITANAKEGAALWDNRSQRMPVVRYGGEDASQSCMSVRFNATGTLLLALRRRLPPILYSTVDQDPICQFYNQDYYNSCTMKTCTFAGPFDEYVLSGSDDFNLYVWRVQDADLESRHQWVDRNQMVLYGHRSIVNQVRYNPQRCLLASSGVEKIIKLWTPFELNKWTGSLLESQNDNMREVFTHEEYMSLNMTHDYSNQNTTEDPRMIAFFDYLVQQEIEGWSSESSNQSSDHTSENSSRPGSPTSDTEPTNTNFNTVKSIHRVNRDPHRRGETSQRHKYRNRIAYLIATKRKSLKKLALKRFTRNASSRRMKNKYVPRQTKRIANSRQFGRKPYDKKMRRLSVQSKYKKPVSHEQTSDSEVPQKTKRRRLQSHSGTTSYRTFRRKAKTPLSSASNTSTRVADKSDSSSSDYDDEDETDIRNGNAPSSTSTVAQAPVLLNIPSTSTGITANGYSFRITNTTYDSDDDDQASIPEPSHQSDSLLRVIRSPPVNHLNNGNNRHHHQFEVNEGASTSTQFRNNFSSARNHHPHHHHLHHINHENGRRKYRKQEEEHEIEDYASTNNSNSLLSSSSAESSSNEESYPDYYSKKRKLNNGFKESEVNDEASTSRNGFLATPSPFNKKTPDGDSGIAPSPSSNSRGSTNLNGQNSLENMKKIDAVKRIYRKNMQTSDDSD